MLYMMDMDGCLIEGFLDKKPREGHEWCDGEQYAAVDLLPNVAECLRYLTTRDPWARFAIITNQAGVAFGYQTEDEVRIKIAGVIAQLEFFWSRPFSVHVCFNHPEASVDLYKYDDIRRKPSDGMLHEAMRYHKVLPHQTLYTGDMETDELAAVAAGVSYMDHSKFFSPIPCSTCGGVMMRAGSTYICQACGDNLGAMS